MFRDILKELRNKKGLTQEQLASLLQVERSTVGKYESSKSNTLPSNDVMIKLSEIFDVSVDYLLGRTKKQNINKDITFDDFTFAMHKEAKNLSEESKDALLKMAKALNREIEREENQSR